MQTHFDFHPVTRNLAIRREHPQRGNDLLLLDPEGQVFGAIDPAYLPLGPRWSPDGESLAFFGNDGVLYLYRAGWQKPQPVFQDEILNAGFCEWSPDGSKLVFSAYPRDMAFLPNIYVLDPLSDTVQAITNDPSAVDRFPQWSPDGKWIVFHREDFTAVDRVKQVYVHAVDTRQTYPLTHPSMGSCQLSRFGLHPTEAVALLTQIQGEQRRLEIVALENGAIRQQIDDDDLLSGVFSPSGSRVLAISRDWLRFYSDPAGAPGEQLSLAFCGGVRHGLTGPQIGMEQDETALYFLGDDAVLYRWEIGKECLPWRREQPYQKPLYTKEEYRVTSPDGRSIPVIRFLPPDPKPVSILYVHGGPGEPIDPDDPFMLYWLAEGVEFVCVAYRGSSGYGVEHWEANRGECGRADVWDLLAAGQDWQQRVGSGRGQVIIGYSYGGFLSLLALQQEQHPWIGGAVHSPVTTLLRIPSILPRALPEDADLRETALRERSPLHWPEKIRVPLLIFHGALDSAASTEELVSFQQQAQRQGGQCKLILYPDDTHGLMRHRQEIHQVLQTEFHGFRNPE